MFEGQEIRVPPSRNETEALERVRSVLIDGARQIGEDFTQPDDDWMPLWMVVEPQGLATMIFSDLDKYELMTAVAIFAKLKGAIAVGFVSSVWALAAEGVGSSEELQKVMDRIQRAGGSLEDVPGREEQVMITTYSATKVELHRAVITRTDDAPPTLGEFEVMSSDDGQIDGAMVTPIQRALAREG